MKKLSVVVWKNDPKEKGQAHGQEELTLDLDKYDAVSIRIE